MSGNGFEQLLGDASAGFHLDWTDEGFIPFVINIRNPEEVSLLSLQTGDFFAIAESLIF
jgi:hypothetical protein